MGKINRIIFATHNKGKVEEMKRIWQDVNILILSADEAGVFEDVVEDGITFEENAIKKAEFIGKAVNEWAMGDDSGICIEALDGAPGVYSARWAGENATAWNILEYTLNKLKGVSEEKRTAWFETAAVLRSPEGKCWTFTARISGKITLEPRGHAIPGMPYDPIFIPDGEDRVFAEMSKDEKNAVGHRGLAFKKLKDFAQKIT